MSFISSVFGMNNKEIGGEGNPMTLGEQFEWMSTTSHPPFCPMPLSDHLTNRVLTTPHHHPPVPLSFAIVAITYYTAFGSPGRMARDLFRWVYIKCGMYRLFAPGEPGTGTGGFLAGVADRLWGGPSGTSNRSRREAEQAWARRRSEQMARDAQDRRDATRRAAIIVDHASSVGPETPVTTPGAGLAGAGAGAHAHGGRPPGQQTGMLAVYQEMTFLEAKRGGRTPEAV